MGSVYLECGIGVDINSENWHRLCRIGEMVAHYGKPFVLGGDWNAPAPDLSDSGWPSGIQGRIATVPSSDLGTCRSAEGNLSSIDYLVMSRQMHLSHQCVSIVGTEPPRPHLPVRVKLHVAPRSFRERTLKKIKQFPPFTPMGPQPRPPDWDTSSATDGLMG